MAKRYHRAQGAMEYLMTYGWAIIVVIVVGLTLWRLGYLNMGANSLTSTGFTKLKVVTAQSGFSSDGTPKLVFLNGAGSSIEISGGSIKDLGPAKLSCALASDLFVPKAVEGGKYFKVSGVPPCIGAGKPGDVYNARIMINYRVQVGYAVSSHTETGTLRGPYE